MRKIFFALSLLAGSLVSSSSYGAFQLTLFAPNNITDTIVDGGAGDLDPTTGLILTGVRTVGGYVFTVSASSSSTTGLVTIQNSSVLTAVGSIPGKVGILASTSGAPTAANGMLLQSNATVSYASGANNSQASVSYQAYVDSGNNGNNLATVSYVGGLVTVVPTGTPSGNASGSISFPIGQNGSSWAGSDTEVVSTNGGPASISLLILAEFAAIGSSPNHAVQLNGSLEFAPVPEPASLAIWAMGGLVGLAVRRRYC